MMKYVLSLLFGIYISTFSLNNLMAEVLPEGGSFDKRVRTVTYNPEEVYKLVTFFGVSSHIHFSKAEKVVDIALGDPAAWEIIPRDYNLYIRPLEKNPETNLTVVTNKHTYHFALFIAKRKIKDKTSWQDKSVIYSLGFYYPEDEAKARAENEQASRLKERLAAAKQKGENSLLADRFDQSNNEDYWVAGDYLISPTKAKDDGRFIYLTFSNNRDMPEVYAVDDFEEESLINTNVRGNTIIVQKMVRKLRLRKGRFVACIINHAFDIDGGKDNNTGTISDEVNRVIREPAE